MIDLDDFKLYNDTCGHNAGDMVLNTAVDRAKCIRKTDILIRHGGDEFLLILPDVMEDVFSKKQNRSGIWSMRQKFPDIHSFTCL